MSESLTLSQLKELKEVSRKLGATSMGTSEITHVNMSLPDGIGGLADASSSTKGLMSTAHFDKLDNLSGASSTTNGLMSTAHFDKLNNLEVVKTGYNQSGQNYAVQLSGEKMYVNVPWQNDVWSASNATTGTHSGPITQAATPSTGSQIRNDMRPIEIDGYTAFFKHDHLSYTHTTSYYGTARSPHTNSGWSAVTSNNWNTHSGFSINAAHIIMTNSYFVSSMTYVSSDRRIKTDIRDVPDHLALEQVLNIPCRYYKYKDVESRGPQDTIGFIAQEVKEVFPEAVTQIPKIIPDHMIMAEVSWEEVDGKHLMSVSNLQEDVSVGTLVKFYCNTGTPPEYNEDGSEKTPASNDFKQTPHEVEMNEDGKFEMDKEYSSVFIYGRQVNDFHVLDKSKIFALHHSAIQELHRVVEAQKATIAALEQQNAAQESALASLLARVEALESQ